MKSRLDPRHKKRRQAVKDLFSNSYNEQKIGEYAQEIYDARDEIDREIAQSAPQWPPDKLNRIDLAILRLAVYEIFKTKTPSKVIVDEAVELAKEFGGESSPPFVNGVLGDILKRHEEITR